MKIVKIAMDTGLTGISEKIMPILRDIVNEIAEISWESLIAFLCISGILFLTGNEFGAKKVAKDAVYGWIIIQLANMLAGH
ncbi:hypothetical protein [Tepidibacter hydrothermalis]|uniref:Uncharacterized protein n=1 Tax=Tepidibacter hydrothermalis TaxID=3036126 RepID=A0ABY8EJN8_9FIRM|nr:hypothetical protein [Tepidibacter hydrothermalis]WFD12027.1 hypothetical protein P4S50_08100 [Tepidibacter hydrothermalis]